MLSPVAYKEEQKMSRPLQYISGLLALIALLVTACAATRPSAVWKDPQYHEYPRKMMVIGVSKKPVNRRIFEDEFTRQLEAHGVGAIESYTVLPDELQKDHAAIAAKVAQQGADTVLITRLVSKKTVQIYVPGTVFYPPPYYPLHNYPPPFYGTWPDYYGYGYQAMYTPGYMADEEFAVIETNLYSAANNKLIWAASTEIGTSGSNQERIKSYIGIMIRAMIEQDLLYK